MLESYPSYFWVVGRFIQPISLIAEDLPLSTQMEMVAKAKQGVEMILRAEHIDELLPRTTGKAKPFLAILDGWVRVLMGQEQSGSYGDYATLRRTVEGFSVSLQDELDRIPMFTVIAKGNLDPHRLCEGASTGYRKTTLELLDTFITDEIDEAGKCLAFELPTSCGFHILRAVETGMKAYLYAATGKLPPMTNRNWGEYITRLTNANAHADLIDVLRVLKAKRNPLMHPTDNLDVDEAIGLLCICQSAIDDVIDDVRRRSLEIKFKEALEKMPNL
jgi:hypothetical protein